MFVTPDRVNTLTGTALEDNALIQQAQGVVEAFIGRPESDVDSRRDLELLELATAYQAAYMQSNPQVVFEQIAASQIGQNGSVVSFSASLASPFMAPLAIFACDNLTWRKTRSVRVGSVFSGSLTRMAWEAA